MLDNIRSTVKNSLIYGLGNISAKLVGFVLIPLYTKNFSTTEYGILGVVEITTQIFVVLFGISLYSAFFRWYWDKNHIRDQKSIFFTILVSIGIVSFMMIAGLWFVSENLANFLLEDVKYTYLIRLMLITAGLEALVVIPATLMRLQEKSLLYSVANLIKLIFSLTLTVYFIAFLGKKVEGIYEAQIIGNIVYLLFLLQFIIKNITFRFDLSILKKMLVFSLPLVVSALSGLILNITDRYTLRFLTNMSEVGIYTLGFKVANIIKVFIVNSVMLAVSPLIFKMMDEPNNRRFYSKILTYTTYIVLPVVLAVSIFGKEAIKILSQKTDYWDAYKIIPILCFAILFGMLKDIAMTGLHLMKKTKTIAAVVFTMMSFNVLLCVVLVYSWQSYGASMAILITQILYFITILRFAQKQYHIPYEIWKIIKMIVTVVALCLIARLFNSSPLYLRLITKTVLIISFPFILYFWNFYEEIELEKIKGAWIKWRDPRRWGKNIKEFKKA
jgi:O-antigen/teichoic acid export membrane protein